MAASDKIYLILKDPVLVPSTNTEVSYLLCTPVNDTDSPLSDTSLFIDISEVYGGVNMCIAKSNILAYLYESTAGSLDTLYNAAVTIDPGTASS